MKELFTLYYHRRILFTDFFSQSRLFGFFFRVICVFAPCQGDC